MDWDIKITQLLVFQFYVSVNIILSSLLLLKIFWQIVLVNCKRTFHNIILYGKWCWPITRAPSYWKLPCCAIISSPNFVLNFYLLLLNSCSFSCCVVAFLSSWKTEKKSYKNWSTTHCGNNRLANKPSQVEFWSN